MASHESSAVMVVPKQPAATGVNHSCRISVCCSHRIIYENVRLDRILWLTGVKH